MPSSRPVGGIRMSVITTSGSLLSMTASSSGRSDAVPTSSKSGWAETSRETPSRRRTLSSASATRMVLMAPDRSAARTYSVRRICPVRSRAARSPGQAASARAASRASGPISSSAHSAIGGW